MLAIVSYPTLADRDREWIEAYRVRHDPQARRIGAHFTLVFPVRVEAAPVLEHTFRVLQDEGVIPFTLRRVEPRTDPIAGGGHVFLLPDEGSDEIVHLHDRLYGGCLRPHLRSDVPFAPHLTIAASADPEACQALARELDKADLCIAGRIEMVDVVEVADDVVRSIARFDLGARRRPSTR